MREIKFRAWDNGKKKWLMGYEMPNLGGFSLTGECVLLGEWSGIIDSFIFERNGHKQDDLKIMQFTGLLDKNGKEIYEGDILSRFCGTQLAVVEFKMGGFVAMIQLSSGVKPHEEFIFNDLSVSEVIGNIYENPELLK